MPPRGPRGDAWADSGFRTCPRGSRQGRTIPAPLSGYPFRPMSTVWDEVRNDFPALEGTAYLNAAATSPVPRSVREAAQSFYREIEQGGDRHWDLWMERQEQVREKVAAFIGADAGRDRLRPQHLDGDEPRRRPPGRRGARALRRARVPDRHPALDPPRHERRLHARGGGSAAPGVVPRRPGPPRGHPLHQPRAVLQRLPLRPRRLRRDQGGPQPRGLRQPERRGLPDRREEEPDRRLRDRRAQVAVRGLRRGLRLRPPGDPGQEAPARHRLDERRAPLRLRQPPDHDQEDLRPRRDGLSVFRPHLRPGRSDRLPEQTWARRR